MAIIDKKLENIGYPYGFTIKKYIVYKYILSSIVFLVILFRARNILLSISLFCLFFWLPNFLIYSYKKTENIKIINEISNIVQNLILSLSANLSLYDSLKISAEVINQKRFKIEYIKFIDLYKMYNFNIYKAIPSFKEKFCSYEFNMFSSILIQGEKEGNLLENLEAFNSTLDLTYFKYLKFKSAQRMLVITLATIISLINSFMVVMYPIAVEISDNISQIFK